MPLLIFALLAATAPDKTVPAINAIDSWQQVGQQPYEMTWTQRRQDPRTLVDFEDLSGWRLELYGGAQGEFRRSREQQMWGYFVAKFQFSGIGKESRVVARPPKPVAIPERFDSVDLWGYGYRWDWIKDPAAPPIDIHILVTDAHGTEHRIRMGDVRWKQWWLVHRRVLTAALQKIAWPASFSGIELSGLSNTKPLYFYCDSLAFYGERFEPLQFRAQPKRNLTPFRGQINGVNTGAGVLPFPTREATILPRNLESRYQVSTKLNGPNRFEFRYNGRDATVVYTYTPAKGLLGEIATSVNGGPSFRPLDGGGFRFGGEVAEAELVSASLANGVVTARFRKGQSTFDYQLRLWQKSLVLDAWCDGGEATELAFGRVSGVAEPRLITVPYITYGSTNPRVLQSGSPAVFTSVWFDWYRSNASEPFYPKDPKPSEINGGMRYIAKTDGKRNNLYERIFITSSPNYEETLPVIPNPPSLRQQEGKQVLWSTADLGGWGFDVSPHSFQLDHERSREIRSYGIDKVMRHSHEPTWRDEGESYTMRLHAAPQKGGDEGLQWYVKVQNALGWLQGIYSNFADLAPTNTNWNPDYVQRQPDGEWRRAWPRNYALKPAKAVEMEQYYAPRLHEKFGTRMSYTDVHTAVWPWKYCDYDSRVPGAGTFAATFYAYGQLLLNDQRVHGPTQSEATFQWLYAGLESGSYGKAYTDVNLLVHPPDVAFRLGSIHPLQCDYGMGPLDYYLAKIDPKWKQPPKRREYLDLFLSTTIAYGNMGWLVTEFDDRPFRWEAMARSYYMLQQLQQQYAFVRARKIEYADSQGQMLTPSQAHATGAIAEGRVHVEYENGTHVYVNRGTGGVWNVEGSILPVSGWLAHHRGSGLYEISGIVGGRRIDYVKATQYEYLDGRGEWTEMGSLGATGSVVRRLRANGSIELIDIYGNQRIAFRAPTPGTLTAFDPESKVIGNVEVSSPRPGWYEFKPLSHGREYIFVMGVAPQVRGPASSDRRPN